MPHFRKKPVVIEAVQYQYPNMDAVADFAGADFPVAVGERVEGGRELIICTLEDGSIGQAKHVAAPGDWIIRGVKGEIYACKPDIFAATYDALPTPQDREDKL